jgi:hypothetical protein
MGFTIQKEDKFSAIADYRKYVVMNKSNHSYAINNKITAVLNSQSWYGRRCFIIGGGESLKGFDFSKLNGELTIGINKAFQFYQDATINYAMDTDFYNALREGRYDDISGEKLWDKWMSFKGLRIFLTPMELKEFGKEIYVIKRILDFTINWGDLEDGIHGGRNSGFGAINLAIALGVNKIYLLGYDMKAKTKSHWHTGYPARNLADFNVKLAEYRKEIEDALPYIQQAGIEVTNLSPDSDLKCFNNDILDNILKE